LGAVSEVNGFARRAQDIGSTTSNILENLDVSGPSAKGFADYVSTINNPAKKQKLKELIDALGEDHAKKFTGNNAVVARMFDHMVTDNMTAAQKTEIADFVKKLPDAGNVEFYKRLDEALTPDGLANKDRVTDLMNDSKAGTLPSKVLTDQNALSAYVAIANYAPANRTNTSRLHSLGGEIKDWPDDKRKLLGGEDANDAIKDYCQKYPSTANWFQPLIKGREYGKNVVDALKNGNATLLNGIKNKFQNPKPNIENYHVATEVRLSVTLPDGTETYMKADAVLIDYDPVSKRVKDVIIIENKLSQSTDFTENQKAGWRELHQNGKIGVESGSIKIEGGPTIVTPELNVPQGRVLKVADHGDVHANNSTFDVVNLSQY
jgi:hypothetical protein